MNVKVEIFRKIMHLSSSAIAFFVFILDRSVYMPLLFAITLLVVVFDLLRVRFDRVSRLHNLIFSIFTRKSEKKQLTGASYLFIGNSIVVFLFPKEIALIGILVLSFSDSFAALTGILFGKTKLFNKTLEGSTAFFISTFTILWMFDYNISYSLAVSLISTLVELFSNYKYNDNISIPLLTCSAIYILTII